jgi:PAS domain S-box-containing protein
MSQPHLFALSPPLHVAQLLQSQPTSGVAVDMDALQSPSGRGADTNFEERYRVLVESLTDYAVFMIDLSGTMASWNPGVKLVLGYDAEEFVGLPFSTIFTPEDIAMERPAQELERALATGRSDDKRVHVRKDGSRFPADGVVTAIRDDAGIVRAFSKVMHDVTVQHRASEALRESEERYRLLVENIRDYAIFLLDPGGHVASWTPEAERIKGYRADEIIGQHFRVFFTPDDQRRGMPDQELHGAVATGRFEGEGWRVRKDGSRFWGDEIVAPILHESGELRGFAKIVRDLTERQRAALEREQLYAQAQQANRLKDEFLGTVSHELRTPLNAILGWAHLLELKGLDLDESRQRRAVRTIARNAEIQVQLVDDLLDVSRIISGKMRLQIRATNLSEVLFAAVDAVRPAATAKNVELRLSVDPSSPTIAADADRLQQIVWNLLSNAIKFTPPGGLVYLWAHQSDGATEIVVRDNGPGMAPEVVPFVFERFRQADSSTTRRQGGVGLGLAIVRHLVELHGGSVDAASEGPGKGSTFTVRLPAAVVPVPPGVGAASPPVAPPLPVELPLLKNVHVVIVDDDADTREVLSTVLTQVGADVAALDSAARALEHIERRIPDVIVADIGMPDEDGYAFIQKVRRATADRGGRAPAIALTAYARREDRERALAAGYQLHLSKPSNPSAVVHAVARLVSASP